MVIHNYVVRHTYLQITIGNLLTFTAWLQRLRSYSSARVYAVQEDGKVHFVMQYR